MVMQSGGRYSDFTNYAFMAPMGIWLENFSLPVIINECLMQSYNGTIHLFPNWDKQTDAVFSTLRAVGAFLVSSKLANGEVEFVHILSEKGSVCNIINPWKGSGVQLIRNGRQDQVLNGEKLTFKTQSNEKIELRVKR